jgi:hypothetical protein
MLHFKYTKDIHRVYLRTIHHFFLLCEHNKLKPVTHSNDEEEKTKTSEQ